MKIFAKILPLISSITLLAGCKKGGGSGDGVASVQGTVSMTCTVAAACADNSADGKYFLYAIIPSGYTCSTFDFNNDGNLIKYLSGVVSCSGGTCTSTTGSEFKNGDTDAVETAPSAGTYSVFYFIDVDPNTPNEGPTSGEPGTCEDSMTWASGNNQVSLTSDLSGM